MKFILFLFSIFLFIIIGPEKKCVDEELFYAEINKIKYSTSAESSVKRVFQLVKKVELEPQMERGEYLYMLGKAVIFNNSFNCLDYIGNSLLELSKQTNSTALFAKADLLLAVYWSENNHLEIALNHALRARLSSGTIKDADLLFQSNYALTEIYVSQNNYFKAQQSCIAAHKAALNAKNISRQLKCNIYLAIISYFLRDYDEAIKYHQLSLEQSKNFKNSDNIALCFSNIGGCYMTLGRYKKAEEYYIKAYNTIKKATTFNADNYARIVDNIAVLKFIQNKDANYSDFKISDSIRRNNNIEDGLSTHYLFLGLANKKLNRYYAAREYFLKAYNNQLVKSNYFHRNSILIELISVDSINANWYLTEFKNNNEKKLLFSRFSQNKYARTAYEAEQLAEELGRAKRDKILIASSGGALSVGLVLMFSLRLQRARRRRFVLRKQQAAAEAKMYKVLIDQQILVSKARTHQKHIMARELHDGVMNHLASTRLNLYQIHKATRQNPVEHRKRFADEIEKIEEELKSLAVRLDVSKTFCLKTAASNLAAQYAKSVKPKVVLAFDGQSDFTIINKDHAVTLYRVLQEALQNAFKYAHAKSIQVTIALHQDTICLKITDDGVGFNLKEPNNGIGIRNMRIRIQEAGGLFEINSGDFGTQIVAQLSVKQN